MRAPRLILSRLALAMVMTLALASLVHGPHGAAASTGQGEHDARLHQPTSVPPPNPAPGGASPVLDPKLTSRAPAAAIGAALANPDTVYGWQQLRNPAAPPHPILNPYRTCLTLRNLNAPYHPLFNGFVFKAGCP